MNKILIIGPGAYGVSLSQILIANNNVSFLGICDSRLKQIQSHQFKMFDVLIQPVNNTYLNYEDCFNNKQYDLIICCVPAKELEFVVNELNPYIKQKNNHH